MDDCVLLDIRGFLAILEFLKKKESKKCIKTVSSKLVHIFLIDFMLINVKTCLKLILNILCSIEIRTPIIEIINYFCSYMFKKAQVFSLFSILIIFCFYNAVDDIVALFDFHTVHFEVVL